MNKLSARDRLPAISKSGLSFINVIRLLFIEFDCTIKVHHTWSITHPAPCTLQPAPYLLLAIQEIISKLDE